MDKLWCVWDEMLKFTVDGIYGKDGVLADVCVTMLETRPGGGEKGLDQLGFAKLAEEAQGIAADVLVGMLLNG